MAEGVNKGTHKFTDRHGREWDLTITLNEAWRVDKAEFDGVSEVDIKFTKPSDEMFKEIIDNNQLMFAVIWYVILPQAEQKDIDYESFCDGIDGSCVWEATMSLMESLQDFFPQARTVLSPMVKMTKRVLAEAKEESIELEAAVTKVLENSLAKSREERDQKRKEASEKLGVEFGLSPASSASD